MPLSTNAATSTLTLRLRGTGDITIDWGDTSTTTVTLTSTYQDITKNYGSPGVYTFDFTAGIGNITGWETGSGNFGGSFPSGLTGLTSLNIQGQNTISDVTTLTGLTYLEVRGSNTISNVTPLTSLTLLSISGNNTIGDVTPLTSLTYLLVTGFTTISDVTPLASLTFLLVQGSNTISDVTTLTSLTYLDVRGSNTISDVTPLINLTSLNIQGQNTISDVTPLTSLTALVVTGSNTISDVTPLTSLTFLSVTGNNTISDVTTLTRLTYLNLQGNNTISDVTPLTSLTSLTVTGSNTISDVTTLTRLTYLNLQGNNTISDVTPLTSLTYLLVSGLNTISDVTTLTSLTFLSIQGNNTISFSANIPWLGTNGARTLDVRNLSTSSIDWVIKSAFNARTSTGLKTITVNGGTAQSPTDSMAALAAGLQAGTVPRTATYAFTLRTPSVETNDSLSYSSLLASQPYVGFYPTADATANQIIEGQSARLAAHAYVEHPSNDFDLTSLNPTYTEEYVKNAHLAYFEGLATDGLWNKITELYLLVGKTFGGLAVKAKGIGALTNVGPFVGADWKGAGSQAGLKGNGSTKALDSSYTITSAQIANLHISLHSSGNYPLSSGFRTASAAIQLSSTSGVHYHPGNPGRIDFPGSPDPFFGHFIGTSETGRSELYYNGVSVAAGTVLTTTGTPTSFKMFNHGSGEAAASLLSTASVGTALTDADAANLYTRTQTYLTALGAIVQPVKTANPTLTFGASTWTGTTGTYSNQGNGALTYAWELRKALDDSVVQSGTGTPGGDNPPIGKYYLWVRASNDGGFDASQDGESASIINRNPLSPSASNNMFIITRIPLWWIGLITMAELGQPAFSQDHNLSAIGLIVLTENGQAILAQDADLTAAGVIAVTQNGLATLSQKHSLTALPILTPTEVSQALLSQGKHNLEVIGIIVALNTQSPQLGVDLPPPETVPSGVDGNGFTPLFAPDGLNAYAYSYSVPVNEDVQQFTVTTDTVNGTELTMGSFETVNFRWRFYPQSVAANTITLSSADSTKFDSWREGMLNGATVKVWRIVNGVMTNVRTSTITAHRASGWNSATGFNEIVPVGTNSYSINYDSYNRPGVAYYYSVVAIDALGNQSAPSSTVSHLAPTTWPATPPATSNTVVSKNLTGSTSGAITAPNGVTITPSNGGRTVTISWNGVAGVVGYAVLRSDYPANEHNGHGLDLSGSGSTIAVGDICWVYKQFREVDRATVLTNRVWDVFLEYFPFTHRIEHLGGPLWGTELAGTRYQILDHDPATSIPNKSKTYARVTVAAGQTVEIARFNHGAKDQDTDFYPVLETGVTYRVEAWIKADANRTVVFDPDLRNAEQHTLTATWNVTTSWQQFVFEFTPQSEWESANGGTARMRLTLTEGVWDVDSVFIFEKDGVNYGATPLMITRTEQVDVIRDHSKIKTGSNGYDLDQLTNKFGRQKAREGLTLADFLGYCVQCDVNPWLQVEMYMLPEEWDGLIEYLAGTSGTWAAKRIAQGQTAPWTSVFDKIYFEISNECWNNLFFPWTLTGTEYGKYTEYVMSRFQASPHWSPAIAAKFKFVLGGWNQNSWTIDAANAAPNAHFLTAASYNGGWEAGSGIPQAGIPRSYLNTMNYTEQAGSSAAIYLRNNVTGAQQPGTYEAGPGYGLSGLNGDSLSRFDDQSQERVMKSKSGGVATIDVFLRGIQEGLVTQNYFTLAEGYRWKSHARHWRGGGTFPAYQYVELFNEHCSGMDLVGSQVTYGPRENIPAFFNDAQNYLVYPAKDNADQTAFYVFQQGTKLCLWAISRKLPYDELPTDNDLYDAADDGFTTAYVRLPISAATTLKRYRMSGSYDQHNVSTDAFIIYRSLNYVSGTTGFAAGTLSQGTVSATITDSLVTGATSGATGQIFRVNGSNSSGWLDLVEITGTFVDGEQLLVDAFSLGVASGTLGADQITFVDIADPKYADLSITETTLTDYGSVRDFQIPGGLPPANADLYVFEGCTPVTTSAAPYLQNIALTPVSGDWPVTLRWETDASAYPIDSLTYEVRRDNTPIGIQSTNTYAINVAGTYTVRPILVSGATTVTFDETKMTALYNGTIQAGRAVITKPTLSDPVVSTSGAVTKTTVVVGADEFDVYRLTGSGSITTNADAPFDYLVVAGGGGGGGGSPTDGQGGGGGGGGVLVGSGLLPAGTHAAVIGTGGIGGTNTEAAGNGTNSTFAGLTAIGGGRGGSRSISAQPQSGGSGGGAYNFNSGASGTSGQGFAGGDSDLTYAGGGGGGAGAPGSDAASNIGGVGGAGLLSSITGTALYYGGGGSGSSGDPVDVAAGLGGGGAGRFKNNGGDGQENTGGGGGGTTPDVGQTGGTGGSGVVIIRIQVQ